MKYLAAVSLLPLAAASFFIPLAAQGNAALTYDQRITCGALLFLSSQGAEDPSMEQQFAAHHLSKAIALSGKAQPLVVADTELRMEALAPAWEQGDASLSETYTSCIATVINEFEG